MECKSKANFNKCNCSYKSCSRKGMCCECISYHLSSRELPACCFPDTVEKTFDRSFEKFCEQVNGGKM